MTIRRRGCWNATVGRRWKRSFSTSRAGARSLKGRFLRRRRNDDGASRGPPPGGAGVLAAARHRHGAALLVSAALVVGAPHRADLLAGRADADVGLPADLYRPEPH